MKKVYYIRIYDIRGQIIFSQSICTSWCNDAVAHAEKLQRFFDYEAYYVISGEFE